MFDLVTGNVERPIGEGTKGSKMASAALHVVVLTLVIGVPLMELPHELPSPPTILAFVAPAPAPPAPPGPVRRTTGKPTGRGSSATRMKSPEAPRAVEPSSEVRTEALQQPSIGAETNGAGGAAEGLAGGAPGGVEGGVVGGVAGLAGGGLGGVVPMPPPPAPRGPVRVGGQIKTPALVHRVEPEYPDLAASARLGGTVILEAVVDETGCVSHVTVLRPLNRILDKAAIEALMQWRYSPLVLNGVPVPFVLTVTFSFHVQ